MRQNRILIPNKYNEEIEIIMRDFYNNLPEKNRRRYAAVESLKFGYGGKKYICEVLGCALDTLNEGLQELLNGSPIPEDRGRLSGGGTKKIIHKIEDIDEVFYQIIKDHTAGDPMDENIKWTNLTIKEISDAFKEINYNVSEHVVKQLLDKHNFVKRKMQKTCTMKDSEDRNEQFERINEFRNEYENSENPVISIDVKKKNI